MHSMELMQNHNFQVPLINGCLSNNPLVCTPLDCTIYTLSFITGLRVMKTYNYFFKLNLTKYC